MGLAIKITMRLNESLKNWELMGDGISVHRDGMMSAWGKHLVCGGK